jgi:hypothetical protein
MFVPGRPFQPRLVLVGKARSLPLSGTPKRYFRLTRLEGPAGPNTLAYYGNV